MCSLHIQVIFTIHTHTHTHTHTRRLLAKNEYNFKTFQLLKCERKRGKVHNLTSTSALKVSR